MRRTLHDQVTSQLTNEFSQIRIFERLLSAVASLRETKKEWPLAVEVVVHSTEVGSSYLVHECEYKFLCCTVAGC